MTPLGIQPGAEIRPVKLSAASRHLMRYVHHSLCWLNVHRADTETIRSLHLAMVLGMN